MKNNRSLVVSVATKKDLEKITKTTKYINIDITNCTHDVIEYFLTKGKNYLYSETIDDKKGYIYVSYEDFYKAENIITSIYLDMPNDLTKLETARYLYTKLSKYVFFDINIIPEKNENYNFSLTNNINNLWGSLSQGRVTDISIAKLYYYICKRLDLDISLEINDLTKEAYNKLIIENLVLNVDLFNDIPYLQVGMKTKYFTPYNEDIDLDKKIKYIKHKYTDTEIDKSLKNIDYTKEDCVEDILYKTQNIIDIENIKPVELSIIYEYLFKEYCPNYNIKINNLFLNNDEKNHFIMISYNNDHYSYNYKKKSFVKVTDLDLIDNITSGKIGLYLNEIIPNIKLNLNI